jgi:hypothetical protein
MRVRTNAKNNSLNNRFSTAGTNQDDLSVKHKIARNRGYNSRVKSNINLKHEFQNRRFGSVQPDLRIQN